MPHRILLVSPTPTHPCNAGNRVRILNMISSLRALGHDVFVLHVERERGDADAMRAAFGDGHFRHVAYRGAVRRESALQRLSRYALQLVDRDARHVWGLDDWFDPAITDAALTWHAEASFTAVVVEYVFLSLLLEAFPPSVLKIIDTHDRFANRHRIYLKSGLPPQFYSTTPRRESAGLDRADVVLAIQDEEREHFARTTRAKVLTLGHLVEIEDCQRLNTTREAAPSALVAGSANPINLDGLQNFVGEVWPGVVARVPKARLLVAGPLSDNAPDAPGLIRLGTLPEIVTAYRQADLAINPVRMGTGLNIKSIEALGFGLPLVTTPSGARGLEAAEGRGMKSCVGVREMQDAIVELLGDETARRDLGQRALAFAREWNTRTVAELAKLLKG
jgi:glycosyltransferase involved in cell wall biosynthesis